MLVDPSGSGNAFPRLETRDLVLRQITASDTAAYFALYSDLEVMRTFGIRPHPTIVHTRQLIQYLEDSFINRTRVTWGIATKNEDLLIGDVGFWRFVKERFRAEVGAKLARKYWKGGYMTQALAAVVEYGFEKMGLHTIEANIDPNNTAGIRLVEKVGFLREGLIKEHSFCPFTEKFMDTALYSVVHGHWQKPLSA
jgi:[ribosomal protein S5]-alanine N-acetyltransferase